MPPIMESSITSKGQTTIPKRVREHLRLRPGDRVKFFIHPDGSVVLLPRVPVKGLRGMLKSPFDEPVTLAEMEEALSAGATDQTRPFTRE